MFVIQRILAESVFKMSPVLQHNDLAYWYLSQKIQPLPEATKLENNKLTKGALHTLPYHKTISSRKFINFVNNS